MNLHTLLPSILACLIAGCATSPKTNKYIFNPPAQHTADQAFTLYRLNIPEYLDSTEMVRRIGTHRVENIKYHKWGMDLRSAMQNYLTQCLDGTTSTQCTLSITFNNFEIDDKNVFHVSAACLFKAATETFTENIAFTIPWKNGDYDSLVSIHEQALATLAAKIREAAAKHPRPLNTSKK